MKYQITRFKSLKLALKQLEPFIRDGKHLQTGKPFKRFGELRSRELLANWLVCAAINSLHQTERLTFSTDPLGGDGIIRDTETERTWPTEHILVPTVNSGEVDVEALILEAIGKKHSKGGAAYASGKTLIVFLNAGGGKWFPNKVATRLPEPLHFEAVWVVGLDEIPEAGEYSYGVTRLDLSQGNAPTWRVRIAKDFDAWQAEPVQ
jgi:hypothetical protein